MFDDLRQAAVAAIAAALPDLRECAAHAGRFDAEELRAFSVKAPSVRVAIVGSGGAKADASGQVDITLRLAAFIVTTDAKDLPRDTAAINIAEAIAATVHANRFGLPGAQPAALVDIQNLYSSTGRGRAVGLWAVSWTQVVRIGTDAFLAEGSLPARLYVGIAPEIGAEHVDDYVVAELPDA